MRKLFVWMALGALAAPALGGHLQVQQVSDSVWVARPVPGDNVAVSNAAFVVMPDRVLLFDTLSSSELVLELLGHIRGVTKLPVAMIAISHWHPDHAGGLDYFTREPRTLIATRETVAGIHARRSDLVTNLEKRTRDLRRSLARAVDSEEAAGIESRLREMRMEIEHIRTLPPLRLDVEVTERTELTPGGRTYLIQHPGPGHTEGDLMIYVAADKVLLAGDLLAVGTLPNLADGYSGPWLERLREIGEMDVEKIVPGHGPVGTKEDVKALQKYLETLRGMVKPIAVEGGSSRDLVQKLRVPAPFDVWDSPDLWFPATLRVLHELKGDIGPAAATSG